MTSERPLQCVRSREVNKPAGLTVTLQDSVLIVALYNANALLPVDIRAADPADWRCGAPFDLSDRERCPLDCAYADGRLFVTDCLGLRIFDVAMDSAAAAAMGGRIPADNLPLVTLRLVSRVVAASPLLTSPNGVAAYATAKGAVRVFVGDRESARIVELTRDGALTRTFQIDGGFQNVQSLALGRQNDRLFALSQSHGVAAITVDDVPLRQLKAWHSLGLIPLTLNCATALLVIDEALLVVQHSGDCVDIVSLSEPFV
jgi:hypothetical protein